MANKQIENIDEKIEQLKAKKRAIQNRDRAKERKARTKRLIELGAFLESRCGELDLEKFALYLDKYQDYIIKNCRKEQQ